MRQASVSPAVKHLASTVGRAAAPCAIINNNSNVEVWLGGLFFPEAYITATRQAVAHRKKWSLETLHLRLDLERVNDPEAFIVDGESI